MPANNVILQSHHVLEQSFFNRHELLKKLVQYGLIDKDASTNRLYLPVDGQLADDLETSPHRGRTRSSYTDGITSILDDIRDSPDGIAAMSDDPIALKRVAAQVTEFQDTLKVALINGDVFTTTPDHLTKDEANAQNRRTISDHAQYRADHVDQLKQLRSMGPVESEWASVTHSEHRVARVIDAIQNTPNTLVAGPGEPAAREITGRMELRLAVSQAEQAGRLMLSESTTARVRQTLVDDLPTLGTVRGGLYDLASAPPSAYKPVSQRGLASMELLLGEVPRHTLVRSGGLLASGVDLSLSAQRIAEHLEQDNPRAAQSEANHALARNVGGWVGGTATAYALGTSGYLPVSLVVADALLMSHAFDKAMELKKNRDIYRQTDRQGVAWEFTGRNWVREGLIDKTPDGRDNPVEGKIGASYEKARELGTYASATAVELALGKVPPPQAPFTVPASSLDRWGLDNPDWRRNPATEQWQRIVKTGVSGANDRGIYEEQTATPERAAELNREAIARIQQNLANGREAIAAAYPESYAAQRSHDFLEVPAAVQAALPKPAVAMGSDRKVYHRTPEGVWTRRSRGRTALLRTVCTYSPSYSGTMRTLTQGVSE